MDALNFMTRNGPLSGLVDRIRVLCAMSRVEDPRFFEPALIGASSRAGFVVSTTPGVGLGFIDLEQRLSELLGEEVMLVARDSPAGHLIESELLILPEAGAAAGGQFDAREGGSFASRKGEGARGGR